MKKIKINPMSRIEGHLDITVTVANNTIEEAHLSGALFRGLELILKDRDPLDATIFTQRICGVCPASHAMTSALCLDEAFGISGSIHKNARIIRNLILGANIIQSDLLHFYHLAILDYVDITAVQNYKGSNPDLTSVKKFLKRGILGPFIPRYEGDYRLPANDNITAIKHYIEAFNKRSDAHEMLAIFGGKMPHQCGIAAGGATVKPTIENKTTFLQILNGIRDFINNEYLHDVLTITKYYKDYCTIGPGCGKFLSYGCFDLKDGNPDQATRKRLMQQGLINTALEIEKLDISKITEDIKYSWYDGSSNLPPSEGETNPNPYKKEAYSFIKSPRYGGTVVETGPVARVLVNYTAHHKATRELVDRILSDIGMDITVFFSIMGRNIARFIECKLIADAMAEWIMELDPDEPLYTEYTIPDESEGFGISGAPRGALGHWMKIENSKIKKYQIVTPTTWNASPRDANNKPGPIEQTLTGLPVEDEKNPFEIVRAVRAFDPCIACAVHVLKPSGDVIGKFRVL
ncbi:MAG: nickel-dependent hydrogenase large subunit [bacterium]|nr:nickel-dependent hydrogenase large subunit [bacterium]